MKTKYHCWWCNGRDASKWVTTLCARCGVAACAAHLDAARNCPPCVAEVRNDTEIAGAAMQTLAHPEEIP